MSNSSDKLTLDEYQKQAARTAIYPDHGVRTVQALNYTLMKLGGEVGEVQNAFGKVLRGDHAPELTQLNHLLIALPDTVRHHLITELGDALWYLSQSASELGVSLSFIAELNLAKLQGRELDGTIKGSGDER